MTTTSDLGAPAPGPAPTPVRAEARSDHRGSWVPTWGMITTRFMELRKRRGLMIALIAVNIGIPVVFLGIRLISHAVDPTSYGPAGGYTIFEVIVLGFMYVFGFIVAAVVGCTAGSVDLTEGMFRHLVITGRSRLAIYFARIPAGLAIVIAMVAIGYTIVCAVCVFAAPTQLNYDGIIVPPGLSRPALESWAAAHADEVICNFGYRGQNVPPSVPCGNGQTSGPPPGATVTTPKGVVTVPTSSQAQIRAFAVAVADQDYADYSGTFLAPSTSLMVDVGLWIALEATIGFIVGLGLASLMGQRTVPVILLVVLELILTPLFSQHVIAYLLNVERAVVGVAMLHIEPGNLTTPFSGGGPGGGGGGGLGRMLLIPESTLVASLVIAGWLVFWTAIGAWRMMTRDA
jgi:hypothetical protein